MLFLLVVMNCQAKNKPEISSDKMEMRRSDNVVIFTGNVKYIQDNQTLFADKVIKKETEKKVYCEGNIKGDYLTQDKEIIKFYCDNAVFYDLEDKTVLSGTTQPHVVYVSTSVPLTRIYSNRITIDNKTDRIEFVGNVLVLQQNDLPGGQARDNVVRSIDGLYDSATKTVTLSSGTINYFTDDYDTEFTAARIVMFFNEKRVVLEQNVHGFLSRL
jgi:lipopolysaccharide export system protein LptA